MTIHPAHGAAPTPGGREVLIVDADAGRRAHLRGLVSPLASYDEAASVEGALAAAMAGPAAVLIDLELPAPGPFELASRLACHEPCPSLLFVARTPPDEPTRRKGHALGALDFLVAPLDGTVLAPRLELVLANHRQARELDRQRRLLAEREAALAAAQAALGEAAAASRTKDLYMGVLGHDLRNPLGAILMSARMLLMRGSLAEADQQALSRIARNGERMAALIRDILDYTRGQAAGGIPIIARAADMGELCQSMIDELTLLHGDRVIRLVSRGPLDGRWDPQRVEQVLSNLLTNALTHGRGDLTVTVDGTGADVVMAVHNDGAIPADQVPSLFEPFRRGAGSRGGLGLGLYIVKEILRAHDGSVEVTSSAEHGTTFITRWPRAGQPSRVRTPTP